MSGPGPRRRGCRARAGGYSLHRNHANQRQASQHDPSAPASSHRLSAPDDLAVIGVDDISVAGLAAPPLTTVAFDLEEVGRHLAEAVAASLAGEDPDLTSLSPLPHVIHRAST